MLIQAQKLSFYHRTTWARHGGITAILQIVLHTQNIPKSKILTPPQKNLQPSLSLEIHSTLLRVVYNKICKLLCKTRYCLRCIIKIPTFNNDDSDASLTVYMKKPLSDKF